MNRSGSGAAPADSSSSPSIAARPAGTGIRSLDDLRARFSGAGARPVHVRRLLRAWLRGLPFEEPLRPRTPRRSLELQAALPVIRAELDSIVTEASRHPAPDGAQRRLFRLASGRAVETVDLPRAGLCVSTQVGCAVGCRFCRTGEDGLLQQLTSIEILAQTVAVRRERPVRRVVLMGMGEPSHNLRAALEALTALGEEGGLAHKNLVFSTVGEPSVFDRLLASRVRPGLALSLHALDADRRAELLPRAARHEPAGLLRSALAYAESTTYPLLVQWTLLEGVNDSPEEARCLAGLLRGRLAVVNYIPFNAVEGSGFRRPAIARCVELVRTVKAQGVRATLRLSAGQEVDAGCGQLRARAEAGNGAVAEGCNP